MTATYTVRVATELLPHLIAQPPRGWTVIAYQPEAGGDTHLVEVRDRRAPRRLNGCHLNPTLMRRFPDGRIEVMTYGEPL